MAIAEHNWLHIYIVIDLYDIILFFKGISLLKKNILNAFFKSFLIYNYYITIINFYAERLQINSLYMYSISNSENQALLGFI